MKRTCWVDGLIVTLSSCTIGTIAAADEKSDVGKMSDRKVAHRSLICQEKEITTGRQYALEIDKSAKLVTNPVPFEYVSRVAQNLARNSDLAIALNLRLIDRTGNRCVHTAARIPLRGR